MFQEAIQNITAVAVMIDDVPYAPIGVLMDELMPAVIAAGMTLGLALWVTMQLMDLIIDGVFIVIHKIKARRAVKVKEALDLDPEIEAALMKVDMDDVLSWYDAHMACSKMQSSKAKM